MRSFIGLVALAAAASAHFTLDYPQTRGFDEDIEAQFCGGFNSTGTRVPFPLTNGAILIDSHHATAQVAAVISFDQNPTSFQQFNQTPSGQSYGLLKPYSNIDTAGPYCWQVDVNALGVQGVTNGTNATIQVLYNGGDSPLFQCSDVTLLTDFSVPSGTCVNGTSSTTSSGSGGSNTATAVSGGASSPSQTTGANGASSRSISSAASGLLLTVAGLVLLA